MGVGAGLYMYDVVVKKFTFAISSPDEFLFHRQCSTYVAGDGVAVLNMLTHNNRVLCCTVHICVHLLKKRCSQTRPIYSNRTNSI